MLIAASAALGAYFGYTVGAHVHVALGVVFAAAALGGELLKPLAVQGTFDSFRSREWMRGLSCTALAAVCIVYSLAAELSLAAGSRGDLAATRQAAADTAKVSRDRRTRAEAELSALAPARPAEVVSPLIARLKASPAGRDCERPSTSAARRACGQIADLESEAARAKRRTELEAVIADTTAQPTDGPAPIADADPLASALASYARATGHDVEPDTIAPWLALIPVLFLELGSALALVVVRALGDPTPPPAPKANGEGPVDDTPASEPPPAASEPVPVAVSRPKTPRRTSRGRRDAAANVIDLVKARGGIVEGGQREIARTLGISKSRANEVLSDLAKSGALEVATSRTGTTVKLATG
ncbi:MAG: hypothetical protein C0519_01360 [Hyphomicrobium sp.]|nr:hypothetical protein [Hyphomicrobium sp.]PPD09555.1 MAG: hypothetical protein CTY28_01745 [Hyphomicrobium sp.]